MANDGWLEQALDEVVKRMASGAPKLKMDDATVDRVKKMYRPGFSKKTEVEWRAARTAILDLAEKAGRISEIGTILYWVNQNKKPGKDLDIGILSLVCTIVSRMDCQLRVTGESQGESVKGAFCPDMDCKQPKIRGERLMKILEFLGS